MKTPCLQMMTVGYAAFAVENFPEPGFDMDEITMASNLEIHSVDSSGVISWNFLGNTPDYPFADWNFNSTTAEDYAWLCNCIKAEGHDIYVADFTEQGAYSCRILVPGMSEIYPVEDLVWENNSIGNRIRPALVRLPALSDDEARALLDDLQTLNLNDERPLWEILGLAIPLDTVWKELRIGELKTLLALAIGDAEATREGCDWIRHFQEMKPARRQLPSCAGLALRRGNRAPGAGPARSQRTPLRPAHAGRGHGGQRHAPDFARGLRQIVCGGSHLSIPRAGRGSQHGQSGHEAGL